MHTRKAAAAATVHALRHRPSAEVVIRKLTSFGDSSQHLRVHGNVIHIAGMVANNGKARSGFKLKIDGHTVEVRLSRGDSPRDTAVLIRSRLPRGYSAEIKLAVPARRPGGPIIEHGPNVPVTLTVTRKRTA
jgi:hypothetical protein